MSQAALFRRVGAPLANARWSWGAVREADGAVFLRVWQDRVRRLNDVQFVQLTHNVEFANDPTNLGHQERNRQIEMIRQGSQCYLVMCQAADVNVLPRKVRDFNAQEVFPGGILKDFEGETWIELLPRISVRQAQVT